jgi:uncharacterized protein (DUF488 family)
MLLATIGYEGASLADFISTLIAAGVERVIDVRQIAQSRRPGFSKNAFKSALDQAGIDYHHIKQLGDPKQGREAARAGNFSLFREIFDTHMRLPASEDALREAISLASEKKSALVCFERDPKHCHRTIVAQQMTVLSSLQITNLGVQPRQKQRILSGAESTDRFVGAC